MPEPHVVGWGILGCGRVTERRIAPVFAHIPDTTLAAFCSRDKAKAELFRSRFGAGRAHGTFEDFLADDGISVVYLASPNDLHAAQAQACLAAGKHVLVDKPMATTSADAEAMAAAARQHGRILGVMHQQRFHPANMHLIRLRDDGVLGKLNLLRVQVAMWYPAIDNWRNNPAASGGGACMDLAPHTLDLMREVAGDIKRVSAQTGNLQFPLDVEDFCAARLEFASGAVGLVDLSYCCHHYGGRVEAFGSEGSFLVDGSMQTTGVYNTWLRRGDEVEPWQQSVCSTDCYRDAIEDFTDAVRCGGEPAISMTDGIRVLRVIEAIYASAESGSPVDVAGA